MECIDNRRPSWSDYFLTIAEAVSTRSTCPRLAVGCVLVVDNHIIATGYNGAPSGEYHCMEAGCKLSNNHCKRSVHAEINALNQLNQYVPTHIKMYVTHKPCSRCLEAAYRYFIHDDDIFWSHYYGD
jgi:dCMP deaminase